MKHTLSPARRHYRAKWIWLGGAISFAFSLPYVLWNMANGWPTLEFFANYEGSGGPLEFLLGQILGMNPLTLTLSLAGLYFYLGTQGGKAYRALGWTFVVLVFVLALLAAKPYSLAPAYPILFAGGAVIVGRLGGRVGGLIKAIYFVLLLVSGLLLAPLAMPILPPAAFVGTYGVMGGAGNAAGAHQGQQGAFPQYLGDRFGWETMTQTVAGAYNGLPAQERSQACIFTSNYGEASALNFLGECYGLPPAISGHNNYYLWGSDGCTGEVMITIGVPRDEVEQVYADVERAATVTCRYCMPEENDLPVYVATKPKVPLGKLWPQTKHYD